MPYKIQLPYRTKGMEHISVTIIMKMQISTFRKCRDIKMTKFFYIVLFYFLSFLKYRRFLSNLAYKMSRKSEVEF